VTTKKGLRGKNVVHYQYSSGVDKPAKRLNLLNATQWLDIHNNPANGNFYLQTELGSFNSRFEANATDWQNAVLQTGVTQNHEISFSGGDEKTRYSISGNYSNQEGIILNSGFERYTGRVNFERNISENFSIGVNVNADRSTQDALTTLTANETAGSSSPFKSGITNSLVYALFMSPVLPIYDEASSDGYNHFNPFELSELNYYGTAANPVADLKTTVGQTISTSILGNFFAKLDFPWVKGLSARFSAGTNINYITQRFFAPPASVFGIDQDIQGRGSVGNRRTGISQSEALLTYTKHIDKQNFIDLLGGYTFQETNTNILIAKATHLESFDNLGFGQELPHFSRSESATLHSFLGRINYTLLERYNLTATLRADKSSRFAAGNEWGFFPSVGLSWNVSDEAFFSGLKIAVPTLKIRATYGSSGNQELGFNEFSVILNAVRYGSEPAAALENPGNPDLKWETTTEYNAGVDAGFLGDRLTLTADVYYKETSDLLSKKIVFPENKEQVFNIGNLTNKGVELSLNAGLIERKNFRWSATANFARNINTITSLAENNYSIGDNQEQILRVGEAFGSFHGFIYNGVVQADEDLTKIPAKSGQTIKAGDVKLRDVSGANGVPDGKITQDDRTIIGSIQPDFTYGFSTSAQWRKWDFFISFQGSYGNEVYNKLRRHLSENNKTYNLSAELLDAWTAERPSTEVPALTAVIDSKNLYSRYVEDGSFLKLRNVTAAYTLPLKISMLQTKIRIFATGQNLLTLTKYNGYDPEIAGGIDTGAYPVSRTFLFGAGITF
ncbi:MAG: SusC/RagA family TonB-linked outer membrane protein, partial [Prevotellaceae bacterium]|nr:SusC/RagA family TonB-linked outer membrane protein [Prevotellaceae bacterium]